MSPADEPEPKKQSALREVAILAVIAMVLYYVMLTFVGAPVLDPVGVDGTHAARMHGLRRRPDHGGQAHLPLRLAAAR